MTTNPWVEKFAPAPLQGALASHQAAVRGASARTGETLGQPDVTDLALLLKNLTYQASQIDQAVPAATAWQKADPSGYAQFLSDWRAAQAQFQTAAAAAQTRLDADKSSIWGSWKFEKDAYEALGAAFMPYEDIDRRLRQSPSAEVAPIYPQTLQPSLYTPPAPPEPPPGPSLGTIIVVVAVAAAVVLGAWALGPLLAAWAHGMKLRQEREHEQLAASHHGSSRPIAALPEGDY